MPTKTTAKKVPVKKPAPKKVNTNEDTVTALTVSGATHEPANRPSSFEALKPNELAWAADELFAVDNDGPPEVIIARLTESGVTWNDYVRAMKLPGWEELPEVSEEPVDFPEPLDEWEETEEEEVTQDVITAAPLALAAEGKYLIKFIGDNWYFERGRFSFSKDNPYALMTARDAQSALVEEPDKFRQAMPQELEDYYS